MKIRRISLVMVIAVALVLMMSGMAMAEASVGSTAISNELNATFQVEGLEKGVVAEEFTVVNRSDINLKGYSVGLKLVNATSADLNEITVELYSGDKLLVTNTSTGLISSLGSQVQYTSPFNIFAEYDGYVEGYWTTGEWAGSKLVVPTKAVITVTYMDGTVATAMNSNLTGDLNSIMPNVDVTPGPFAVASNDDQNYYGYAVDFSLVEAKPIDVDAIEVKLVSSDGTVLITNTANSKFLTELSDVDHTSPFNVFGDFADGNYTEEYWDLGAWNRAVSHLVVPAKAVITVTFVNGEVVVAENNNLTGDSASIVPDELITLSWDYSDGQTVAVDEEFSVSVTATSDYVIDNVLFIVEINDVNGSGFTAVGTDNQNLGYDEDGGFWFWGPSGGFTFNSEDPVTSTFDITTIPGAELQVKVYAVQLP
ncbi:MAG: hypothetical protein APF76_03000 [Desulfitibacter sp. BRH_c19]|nr:MAG: hypothetical protein APF76_03000 [Desulfitibacter sp. BRH_c19]